MTTFIFQHQADTEKGFQVREQVCETPKEGETFSTKKTSSSIVSGCGVQLPKPAEDCQEEGVLHGRGRRRWGQSLLWL